MQIIPDLKNRSVTLQFEDNFDLREAAALPDLVARMPASVTLRFDLAAVHAHRVLALASLGPALRKLPRSQPAVISGLEDDDELTTVTQLAAAA